MGYDMSLNIKSLLNPCPNRLTVVNYGIAEKLGRGIDEKAGWSRKARWLKCPRTWPQEDVGFFIDLQGFQKHSMGSAIPLYFGAHIARLCWLSASIFLSQADRRAY